MAYKCWKEKEKLFNFNEKNFEIEGILGQKMIMKRGKKEAI